MRDGRALVLFIAALVAILAFLIMSSSGPVGEPDEGGLTPQTAGPAVSFGGAR